MPSPPVVPPQMGPETHGFAPVLRTGAPLLWTFAWETPLGEAGQAAMAGDNSTGKLLLPAYTSSPCSFSSFRKGSRNGTEMKKVMRSAKG